MYQITEASYPYILRGMADTRDDILNVLLLPEFLTGRFRLWSNVGERRLLALVVNGVVQYSDGNGGK